MHAELRRCNSIGDSRGITYFSGVILSGKPIKRESARQICSFVNDIRLNFNAAIAFFEYLGLIEAKANNLISSTDLGLQLKQYDSTGFQEALCHLCLQKVVDEGHLPSKVIRFDAEKGRYIIQKHGFPISAAVFRNFLIQMKALLEQPDGGLLITEQYEKVFAKVQKAARRKMSLDELRLKLEQQEEQGAKAEAFVLEYEHTRLQGSSVVQKVKQISEIDVTAGYDIISFADCTSTEYDRFIEVKSFKGSPHFYWSKNEMEVATLYGDKYYIYLVDIDELSAPGYCPQIICNPGKTVVESDGWILQPASYLVIPV